MENVKKRRGERKMRLQDKLVPYLEYCTYRKELDQKTVKAYRIDLNQYFTFVACEEPDKEKIANSARTVRLFRNRRYIHSDLVVRVFCSKRYVFPLLL